MMVDTAVHIKGGGRQEILIDRELEFFNEFVVFSFVHSYRGTHFHSHNFSIKASFSP